MLGKVDPKTKEAIEADIAEIDAKPAPKAAPALATEDGPVCQSCKGTGLKTTDELCPDCHGDGKLK